MLDISRIIDHHCHGVITVDLERPQFEALMAEAHLPPPEGCSHFDKPIGLMVRRFCAPILDLDPLAPASDYVARRLELGGKEASRRLMRAAGMTGLLIDTGHRSDDILDVAEMAEISGCRAEEVVRIEAVMQEVAKASGSAQELIDQFAALLLKRSTSAIALKTIVAYRVTFDIDQTVPSRSAVLEAAGRWLRQIQTNGWQRLEDPILIRYALFSALEICAQRQFPLQLHVGVGDCDIQMPKCDPTVFIPYIKEAEIRKVPITLLHCYPFVHECTWMAEVFQNIYYDVGFTLNYTGAMAKRTMEDALEMGPFFKQLYSSDAFGLAELHHLGRVQFERMLNAVLSDWISAGDINLREADKIVQMIAYKNTDRIYNFSS